MKTTEFKYRGYIIRFITYARGHSQPWAVEVGSTTSDETFSLQAYEVKDETDAISRAREWVDRQWDRHDLVNRLWQGFEETST